VIPKGTRLVVVSNRLPLTLEPEGDSWSVRPASGGLVTALAPVLRDRGGLWVGWTGNSGVADLKDVLDPASKNVGYQLEAVQLTEEQVRNFYYGFANEIIWPLFHDLQTNCNFKPEYWGTYLDVNRKFAEAVAGTTAPDDYVWVHDYHLIPVAEALRGMGADRRIGFFLHIPFPPPDIFVKLPWRTQLLKALLQYDIVGFQTMRDRRNFVACLQQLMKDVKTRGRGPLITVRSKERTILAGCFPIGIDFDDFAARAVSREVSDQGWYLHEALPERQIILSLDRLDYTKGILERLEGFRRALILYPDLHEKVTLVQVVVPSREEVPHYQYLKTEIEQLVGRINGEFTRPGWVPIHYLYRHLERDGLIAHYRVAEIGLVTPLKDGMNLVAKEYCASDVEETGVLILSEFAGAAAQLYKGALLVNPYDSEGMAEAIHKAFIMPREERAARMRRMREIIKKTNVFWWVDSFMRAAFTKSLGDFPVGYADLKEMYEEKNV